MPKTEMILNQWLTLSMLMLYFAPKHKDAKIFENPRNHVMLVFIG